MRTSLFRYGHAHHPALGLALGSWLTESRPPTSFHRLQMGRDMQEIEPTVGAQMVGLIYKEAESDLQPLVDEGGGVGAADASLRRQCDNQSFFFAPRCVRISY
jgi:hypothetical protein